MDGYAHPEGWETTRGQEQEQTDVTVAPAIAKSACEDRTVFVVRSELLSYSETFVKEQVQACSHWKPVLVGLRRVPGLAVEELDSRLLPTATSLPSKAYRKLLAALEVTPGAVRRELGPESASLIHVHFGTDAVENWSWIKSLGLPVLITLHGYDINTDKQWWRSRAKTPAQRRYPDRLLRLARDPRVNFVAVSNAIRNRAMDWGIPAHRIFTRYIGVDLNSFQRAGPAVEARSPRVLFVGRMVEKKGAEYLIRAFARIRAQVPKATLVMVGDGPLRARLAQLASELNVPVSFPGPLRSPQVVEQLQAARVFCSPSITAANGDAEGLPIVIVEAQACGVPVVTSARGGADEGIIDGVTGFAFQERDIDSLSAHLLRLLRDDELAAAMSRAARRNVEQNFDLQKCTRSLEQLYDMLTGNTSTGIGAIA